MHIRIYIYIYISTYSAKRFGICSDMWCSRVDMCDHGTNGTVDTEDNTKLSATLYSAGFERSSLKGNHLGCEII